MLTMLNFMLILVILFLPSIYLLIKYQKKIETTLPFVFISDVLVMFLFGIFHLLKFSVYVIAFASAVFLILSIVEFIKSKEKKKIIQRALTPGMVIYVAMILFICLYNRGKFLTLWDEFSHWGDVVKAMYLTNDFSTGPHSLSLFQSYLPGMSLFQYLFQSLSFNGFYEPYLFISYQMFLISLFLPFIQNLKWKEVGKNLLIATLVVFGPVTLFNEFYDSIYVDAFLGSITAFCFAQLYMFKIKDKVKLTGLVLSTCMLVLVKDIGIFLAGFSTLVLFIFCLRDFCLEKNKKFMLLIKKLKPFIITLAAAFFVYGLWKLNIFLNHAEVMFDNPFNIKQILQVLLGQDHTYRSVVRDNFITALKDVALIKTNFNLNIFVILLSFLFLFFIIYNTSKEKCIEKKITVIVLFVGQVIYTIMHLVLYITKFTEYEALRLASFDRYMCIYLSAIFIFLIMIGISSKKQYRFSWGIYALTAFVIVFTPITSVIHRMNEGNANTYVIREPYIDAANQVHQYLKNEKKRIYIISEHTSGFDYHALKYSFRENLSGVSPNNTWSIGVPAGKEDVWTWQINDQQWWKQLEANYDYVYLYHVNESFINSFQNLFVDKQSIHDRQLYKVDVSLNKLVLVA